MYVVIICAASMHFIVLKIGPYLKVLCILFSLANARNPYFKGQYGTFLSRTNFALQNFIWEGAIGGGQDI